MALFESKSVKSWTRYVVNGQEYRSLDEMPEQFRAMFEDRDGDGCPDWIQDKIAAGRHAFPVAAGPPVAVPPERAPARCSRPSDDFSADAGFGRRAGIDAVSLLVFTAGVLLAAVAAAVFWALFG